MSTFWTRGGPVPYFLVGSQPVSGQTVKSKSMFLGIESDPWLQTGMAVTEPSSTVTALSITGMASLKKFGVFDAKLNMWRRELPVQGQAPLVPAPFKSSKLPPLAPGPTCALVRSQWMRLSEVRSQWMRLATAAVLD